MKEICSDQMLEKWTPKILKNYENAISVEQNSKISKLCSEDNKQLLQGLFIISVLMKNLCFYDTSSLNNNKKAETSQITHR